MSKEYYEHAATFMKMFDRLEELACDLTPSARLQMIRILRQTSGRGRLVSRIAATQLGDHRRTVSENNARLCDLGLIKISRWRKQINTFSIEPFVAPSTGQSGTRAQSRKPPQPEVVRQPPAVKSETVLTFNGETFQSTQVPQILAEIIKWHSQADKDQATILDVARKASELMFGNHSVSLSKEEVTDWMYRLKMMRPPGDLRAYPKILSGLRKRVGLAQKIRRGVVFRPGADLQPHTSPPDTASHELTEAGPIPDDLPF